MPNLWTPLMSQAVLDWIDDPSQPLGAHLSRAFDDLRALSAAAQTS